jgi:hypothetical protein
MDQETSQAKFLLTKVKFALSVLVYLLIGLAVVAGSLVGFFNLEQYICAPKVNVAVESFIEQVEGGNYENFLLKGFRRAHIFQSPEDFGNFKRGISGKYSVAIKEWEGVIVFVEVEFASAPRYAITAMPEDSNVLLCLGKDYKVFGVTRWE